MNTIILVDVSLGMLQKTNTGVPKIDFLKSVSFSLYRDIFQIQKVDSSLNIFDSTIHTNDSFDAFSTGKVFHHNLSFGKKLHVSTFSDLFESLKTVLNFSRFIEKGDLMKRYLGTRILENPVNVNSIDHYFK